MLDHELKTPGTNKHFTLTTRRLRYTFGTRLAAQGAPPAAIADALDHTDLQHVGVYVRATGEIADRLETAIGKHLKPWVDAFINGPVNTNEAVQLPETVFHPDPRKFVGIGSCGLKSQCHLFPPLTCYGCEFFHPWLDADHQSVLDILEDRKAGLISTRADEADRIPHQLDTAIFQVKIALAAQSQKKKSQ